MDIWQTHLPFKSQLSTWFMNDPYVAFDMTLVNANKTGMVRSSLLANLLLLGLTLMKCGALLKKSPPPSK